MTTAKRIFQGLPDQTRKSIINQIVNVQGLKSPRTKEFKQRDHEFFGRVKTGNFLPALFEISVKQHL